MFTWAMASVLADEYPKPWARDLSYGAAFTVTFTRFMAGIIGPPTCSSARRLGIAIAENTFHARCDPGIAFAVQTPSALVEADERPESQ